MKVFIFDFDGTLTMSLWRNKFHANGEYDRFHDLVESDLRNEEIFDIFVSCLADDDKLVFISTARPRKHLKSMLDWIADEMESDSDVNLSQISILCRDNYDVSTSPQVKRKNLNVILGKDSVSDCLVTIYEDRQDCIDMYNEFDVNAIKVTEL